jgi:hypothetical protein
MELTMIRRYIPIDQRNKNRVWPCRSASGATVVVACDKVTFTTEDLTEWVRAGLLVDLGTVDEFGRTPDVLDKIAKAEKAAEKPPVPDYIKKDNATIFADALNNAFAKPAVQVPAVEAVVAPVVAPEPTPVAAEVVAEVVPEVVAEDSSETVAEPVPAELTEDVMLDMTRAQLWEIIVGRSLQAGLSYRNVAKSEMIHIILGD